MAGNRQKIFLTRQIVRILWKSVFCKLGQIFKIATRRILFGTDAGMDAVRLNRNFAFNGDVRARSCDGRASRVDVRARRD